jgi:hypothetical protein
VVCLRRAAAYQRQGLATQLMVAVDAWARVRGARLHPVSIYGSGHRTHAVGYAARQAGEMLASTSVGLFADEQLAPILNDLQVMERSAKVSHKGSHRSTFDARRCPLACHHSGGVRRSRSPETT